MTLLPTFSPIRFAKCQWHHNDRFVTSSYKECNCILCMQIFTVNHKNWGQGGFRPPSPLPPPPPYYTLVIWCITHTHTTNTHTQTHTNTHARTHIVSQSLGEAKLRCCLNPALFTCHYASCSTSILWLAWAIWQLKELLLICFHWD